MLFNTGTCPNLKLDTWFNDPSLLSLGIQLIFDVSCINKCYLHSREDAEF